MEKSMTFEEMMAMPLHKLNYKYEEYREENVVSKHTDITKDYDDPALAEEDYKAMKRSYELRAEFANRYSNCKAEVKDEVKKNCFGREERILTYTEEWDAYIHPAIIEIITLK